MLAIRQILPTLLLIAATCALPTIIPTTPVVSMLGMIPECSVGIFQFLTQDVELMRLRYRVLWKTSLPPAIVR
jgi:hypothetical protein